MIGRWLSVVSRTRAHRMFVQAFGAPDFHAHLRLAPLQRYAGAGGAFCELGCGIGINLIELLLRDPRATGAGLEVEERAVAEGRRLAEKLGLGQRLAFERLDVSRALPDQLRSADCVLLLDVLEHLPDPAAVAGAVVASLKPGARVLVSVPTPLYPKMFGRRYHDSIGHLHDGFGLDETDRLFAGLQRVRHEYSTGPLSWPGVLLYYRTPWPTRAGGAFGQFGRALAWLMTFASLPFRFIDGWNGARLSCSLFAEYRKAP